VIELPRNPNSDESRNEYTSFCIKWMIDNKEYPNTEEGRKQAAGHCYSIYDEWKKKQKNERQSKERLMLHLDAQLFGHLDLSSNKEELKIDRCTMLVGDGTYNGVFFPKEELELSYGSFEKKPINLNHSADAVEDIVGYLEDVRYNDGKITAKPVFDEETGKYKSAMGYMKSRFNAGSVPNVSVGVWLDRLNEEDESGKERMTARNLDGDHLALVVHGACNPNDGCGIGMSENQPIPIRDKSKMTKITIEVDSTQIDEAIDKLEKLDELAKYNCECIKCGHKMTSDEHCKDIKCSECGGTMRRVERPGPGQEGNQTITIPHEDYIEKNEEYENLKKEILKEKIKKEEARND